MFGLFRRKKVDPRKELSDVLGGAALPSFPAIQMQVLRSLRQEDISLGTVGDMVMRDPGLSTKVLSTVNCAGFGLKRRVDNVSHAVSLLGVARLESVVLSLAVASALPSKSTRGFQPRRFWRAAARRATTALALADLLHPASRSIAFTAGLLQDMAVPLLAHALGQPYDELLQRWYSQGGDLAELEREAFGWDHGLVACWMADGWRFPEPLGYAIGGHHGTSEPELQAPPPVALVATLGEQRKLDTGSLVEQTCSTFHAEPDDVADAIKRGVESASEIARLFTYGGGRR